ncbi:MAG: hypothetical protein RIC57_09245 [Balneola sp.]
MADPTYRIYYGKFPDLTSNEIPTAHIREVNFPSYRIDPGKPGEPKISSLRFTLDNLSHDDTERYDRSWVETNSRSEGEGATLPDQLFFKVVVTGTNIEYLGVLSGKSYGAYKATATFTIKSLLSFIQESKLKMLKEFTFEECELISKSDAGIGTSEVSGIPDGFDLESNAIGLELLTFRITVASSASWLALNIKNSIKNGWNFHRLLTYSKPSNPSPSFPTRNALDKHPVYIKIGETTLLTTLQESFLYQQEPNGFADFQGSMNFNVWHAKNGNIQNGDQTTLERGRFFKDSEGTDYEVGDKVSITLYEYKYYGFSVVTDRASDVAARRIDLFDDAEFLHGCEVSYTGDPATQYDVEESAESYFDILDRTIHLVEGRLLDVFYNNSENSSIFDLSQASTKGRYVFWSDLMHFGWINNSISETIVDLSIQTNSYLFINEAGRIVFQDRLIHESTLPGSLPSGSSEVKLEDIKPLNDEDDSKGFSSYEVTYKDILEINNQISSEEFKIYVTKEGSVIRPDLRNTELKVENYRSSNLGVPGSNDPSELPAFRYSPEDGSFPGSLTLDDFINDPITQAENFAKSFSYPVIIWDIEIGMNEYPNAGIGKYIWVAIDGINKVYFIREFHPDPDRLTIGIKAQYVGVYEP